VTQLAQQWERVLDGLGARLASLIEVNRAQPVSADERGIVDVHRMPTTLVQLAESLPLEDLDIAVLLIASAISLDPRFEAYYVALNNDVNARGPTVSTALRLSGHSMLEASARRRLRPDAPLRTLGLIDVGPTSRALPTQVITVPERVIGHLLGDSMLEAALARAHVIPDRDPLDAEFLPEPPATGDYPVVLRARAGTAALDVARRIALESAGEEPLIIDARHLDLDPDRLKSTIEICVRESALSARVLVIDVRACGVDTPVVEVLSTFFSIGVPAVILVDSRRSLGPWERRTFSLELPSVHQRQQWWRLLAPDADPSLAQTATHLEPDDIAATVTGAESAALLRVSGQERRARIQTVKPALVLADVVLEQRPARQLLALRDRVRYRTRVLDEWGMRPGGARGRGVTALFAGPSGTGKSMSAEALAGELTVPLFIVDLASVVDKYIGETEKNLEEVFRAVENEDGVLLFDEADALFGKRSDVSDARDRYANIEVAYLLQRIEAFDGLAILTTNLRSNLDDAFQRRLDMIVEFPEPDQESRREIWRAALHGHVELLTPEHCDDLSILDLTGGYIRAAVISAAYSAAAHGSQIEPEHVLHGAREEWRKSGRLNFPEKAFTHWPALSNDD
jgi:AAA+ superfamily predicted ATPase